MDFEFIDENDIESVKRGRKSQVPQELVDAIRKLTAGKALALRAFAGDPKDDGYKSYKASTSATIRSAAKLASVKVTVSWSPNGVPQVALAKTARKSK